MARLADPDEVGWIGDNIPKRFVADEEDQARRFVEHGANANMQHRTLLAREVIRLQPYMAAAGKQAGPPHQRDEFVDGLVDYLVSPFSVALSVASCSNSAESFPWISMTFLDVSSSPSSRAMSRFSRAISRSRGSALLWPAELAGAASEPLSRWLRQVVMFDE